jgi:cytochrome P450
MNFNIYRFQEKAPMQNGAFFPFGLGPRICLGQFFALVEAKIILTELLSRTDIQLRDNQLQTYEANIIYKPTNNLKAELV